MLQATHAFASPAYVVFDSSRVACVVLGVLTMAMGLRVAFNPFSRAYLQAIPWGGLACGILVVSATFTELGRIGHPVTWRLPFNLTGEGCSVIYYHYLSRIHADRNMDRLVITWPSDLPEESG